MDEHLVRLEHHLEELGVRTLAADLNVSSTGRKAARRNDTGDTGYEDSDATACVMQTQQRRRFMQSRGGLSRGRW